MNISSLYPSAVSVTTMFADGVALFRLNDLLELVWIDESESQYLDFLAQHVQTLSAPQPVDVIDVVGLGQFFRVAARHQEWLRNASQDGEIN